MRLSTTVLLLVALMLGGRSMAAAPKTVLVVHSYDSGYDWTAAINSSLHERFRKSPAEIQTHVEFLDARRNPNWRSTFASTFAVRFPAPMFDLVLLVDDEAAELWCSAPRMFGDTPILFGGVTSMPSCAGPSSTGILESFNIAAFLQFGTAVRPDPRQVIVLSDGSALANFLVGQVKGGLPEPLRSRVEVWKSSEVSFAEVLKRVPRLDPSSIVYIAIFQRDYDGTYLAPVSHYGRIGKASSVPVIALSHYSLPGVLAGSPNAGTPYGTSLAELGLRLLAGTPPLDIPVTSTADVRPQVETAELERWEIRRELAPPTADWIDRNPSFVDKYRSWIIAGIVFAGLQSLLLLALGLNILARRRAQQQLSESNQRLELQNADYRKALDQAAMAAESKSRFVANMSHELRTPLNGILGMSELLLDEPLQGDHKGLVSTVRSSARHLLVILNDILDVSQVETGRLKIMNKHFQPMGIVDEATQLFQPSGKAGYRLVARVEDGIPEWLDGDPARLRQILFNLIGNAIKFAADGDIVLAASYHEGWLTMSVTDNGIGIEPSRLAEIFERFAQVDDSSTRAKGGLGLGLYIARNLATAMGGTLEAESTPGIGSKFTLRLPLPKANCEKAGKAQPEMPPDLKASRVLVVEDNPVNMALVRRMLERRGCDVTLAVDGQEAVEASLLHRFDLILMDLQMPRMDGFEAARAIRELQHPNAHVPIIALTACVMPSERERCMEAGMNDHVSKPIERAVLEATLARWLVRS